MTVVKKGGLLFLESKEKYWQSAPLIPVSDNIDDWENYIITASGEKTLVEFTVDASENVDLYLERYILHKIAQSR